MNPESRIERTLADALASVSGSGAPPRLAEAMRYAVFPGGARMRPRLCLAVAAACGAKDDPMAEAAAASIEFMHCASLVHDDLPCFDDADIRRGKPSVHRAYDEATAVLVGDAMIVLAFDVLCRASQSRPDRLAPLVTVLARAVGMPGGIIAGQGYESEPDVDLSLYQRAKTGSLFVASVEAGAVAAGQDPSQWTRVGLHLGEAYQVADDLHDALTSAEEMGKPSGQDAAHLRPNAIDTLGISRSSKRLRLLLDNAADAVPPCAGSDMLRGMISNEAKRFMPRSLATCAA